MSKGLIILLFVIIYGMIWLYCAIGEARNEDERLDKLYKSLEEMERKRKKDEWRRNNKLFNNVLWKWRK